MWNRLVGRLPKGTTGFGGVPLSTSQTVVPIRNNTEEGFKLGQPLSISSYDGPSNNILEVATNVALVCVAVAVNAPYSDRMPIAATDIPSQEYGFAVVSGLCIARIGSLAPANATALSLDLTTPDRFNPDPHGEFRVIVPLPISTETPTERYCLILAGEQTEQLFRFATTGAYADVAANKVTANVSWLDGTQLRTRELDDPAGIFIGMPAGTKGLCIRQRGKYQIIQAGCF